MKIKTCLANDAYEVRHEKVIGRAEFDVLCAQQPAVARLNMQCFWDDIVEKICHTCNIVHAYDGTNTEDRELFVREDKRMYVLNYITCEQEIYNCVTDRAAIQDIYKNVCELLETQKQVALESILDAGSYCHEVQVKQMAGDMNLYFVPRKVVCVSEVSVFLCHWLTGESSSTSVAIEDVMLSKIWAIGLSTKNGKVATFKVNLLVEGIHTD